MPVLTSDMANIGIAEGLGYSVLGLCIVFAVLIVLWGLIAVISRVIAAITKKDAAPKAGAPAPAAAPAAPAPAAKPAPAPGTAGELILKNVSERDAALIMAIVANKLQKPLNELRFKSITEVK